MLSPDTSRNCRLSMELYQDMRNCFDGLVSIASKFLPKACERVSNQLASLEATDNPITLRNVNREFHLAAHLVDAIEVLATILNGPVVSNSAERKLGEQKIGECVTSLRSLSLNKELCSLGSRVSTSNGEIKDRSLGYLLEKHSDELENLVTDSPFSSIELPQIPSIRRVTFE
jgi:hypothetical protein